MVALTLPLISDRRSREEEEDDDDDDDDNDSDGDDGDDGDHEDDIRKTRIDAVNCLKLPRACARSALRPF